MFKGGLREIASALLSFLFLGCLHVGLDLRPQNLISTYIRCRLAAAPLVGHLLWCFLLREVWLRFIWCDRLGRLEVSTFLRQLRLLLLSQVGCLLHLLTLGSSAHIRRNLACVITGAQLVPGHLLLGALRPRVGNLLAGSLVRGFARIL